MLSRLPPPNIGSMLQADLPPQYRPNAKQIHLPPSRLQNLLKIRQLFKPRPFRTVVLHPTPKQCLIFWRSRFPKLKEFFPACRLHFPTFLEFCFRPAGRNDDRVELNIRSYTAYAWRLRGRPWVVLVRTNQRVCSALTGVGEQGERRLLNYQYMPCVRSGRWPEGGGMMDGECMHL